MPISIYSNSELSFNVVQQEDIALAQEIFERNSVYHNSVVHKSPSAMAEACFHSQAPAVKNSRVFKYFLLIDMPKLATKPVAVLDLFVGFPNYKMASIATLLVRENLHRKGIASSILASLPQFLQQAHPACTTLSISVTDNNVAALRCLVKNEFKRVDSFLKIDANDREYTALTYRKSFKE
ncbi:MAG: GNAT family N-acetyltransferase [Bradymonadales bacterium]